MKTVVVVTATRLSEDAFWGVSPLGQSLRAIGMSQGLTCRLTCENGDGLPSVYNRAIVEAHRDQLLLFVHDDVYIDDYWLVQRLNEAAQRFDVIGLAGNARVAPGHLGWAFVGANSDGAAIWDEPSNLSGRVCHMSEAGRRVSLYGPAPRECRLLDGLFIAADTNALLDRGISFDERFDFHFYDLDFTRRCSESGLRVGTWPIAVTHASAGGFGSPAWQRALLVYRGKWG